MKLIKEDIEPVEENKLLYPVQTGVYNPDWVRVWNQVVDKYLGRIWDPIGIQLSDQIWNQVAGKVWN